MRLTSALRTSTTIMVLTPVGEGGASVANTRRARSRGRSSETAENGTPKTGSAGVSRRFEASTETDGGPLPPAADEPSVVARVSATAVAGAASATYVCCPAAGASAGLEAL